ncbi:hypothetical protein ACFOW4_20025 [Micromonospora sp. GCM10011542]|uniref:hypothetical protein n=1 Tax=Micromonospora sp. GCM10011542 TaxID=3317337 RepID=UPI003614939B
MGGNGPVAGPLPYAEVTDEAYAERAAAGFTAQEFGSAVLLSGLCPRCHHPTTSTLVDELYRRAEQPAAPAGEPGHHTVLCECEAEHPSRPEGLLGCGAYWTLRLEVEA